LGEKLGVPIEKCELWEMERGMENEERETFAISSFRNRDSSHYSLDMKLPIGLLFGG